MQQASEVNKEPQNAAGEAEHPGFEIYKGIEFPVQVVIVIWAARNEVKNYEIIDKHDNVIFTTKNAKEADQMEKLLNFLHLKTGQLQATVIETVERLGEVQASAAGKMAKHRTKAVEAKKEA